MTLKDIADKAGVSTMTVSNVINGKHGRVSAKTIERVNRIIEECGYAPNLSARSLTNKCSNIIGIIITAGGTDVHSSERFLEDPYISTMLGTIEGELRRNGYYTMIRSITNMADLTSLMKNWNLDGIIFLYPPAADFLTALMSHATCPVAVFDSNAELPGLVNVCSDDRKGLYLSTKYMINHGHVNIAFVADYAENPLLTARFQGYLRALEESRIPFRPEYVFPEPPSYQGGISAGKKIASLRNGISAAVTTADICAIGIMEGARLGGYRVPVNLSVIGYDNLSLCQYTSPKLTSISQNVEEKARRATELLLEKIHAGKETVKKEGAKIVLDVELVERQSTIEVF